MKCVRSASARRVPATVHQLFTIHRSLFTFLFTLPALIAVQSLRGADVDNAADTLTNAAANAGWRISVLADAGYRQSFWTPGFRRDVVDFRTEGLQSFTAGACLLFREVPVMFYHYEGPFERTPSQEELFERNVEQASALKKIRAGLLFGWVGTVMELPPLYLQVLNRLEWLHAEEAFFGDAVAVKKFAYVPSTADVEVDGSTATIGGLVMMQPGDTVAFRTEFKEDDISLTWPVSYRDWKFQVRAGYFSARWFRPSDLDRQWYLVDDHTLLLYETEFMSKGFILGVEPQSRSAPGPGGSVLGRWGLDNHIRNEVNRDYEVEPGKDLLFAAGVIDGWYNWRFASGRWNWTLTAGASIDRRIFATELHPLRGTWESENLYRIYCGADVAF